MMRRIHPLRAVIRGVASFLLLAGCDSADQRPGSDQDAPDECVGSKCDAAMSEGGDEGSAAPTGQEILDQLRACAPSDDTIETDALDCLEDVRFAFEDAGYDMPIEPMDLNQAGCRLVHATTWLPTRGDRREACERRAEVVLYETVLASVPFGDDPLDILPSDRAGGVFGKCIADGGSAEKVLQCAQDRLAGSLDDVRHNLVIEYVEGAGYSPADAEKRADEDLDALLGRERTENARLCEDIAEDHPKPEAAVARCHLEFEAHMAYEFAKTMRWS